MDKDILFYSNECEYSKRLLEILDSERIGFNLFRICVDGVYDKIPNFVTCVPTIFLREKGMVLCDDQIQKWINIQRKALSETSLEPYSMLGGAFSASFSALDGSDDKPNNNFMLLGGGMNNVNTGNTNITSKADVTRNYEKMMNDRKMEMSHMKRV
tara:strand:- start:111 stop:578 length:468 start_codon:yes stop_codon:yes gene_type:complete